jgi:hypothetical protein
VFPLHQPELGKLHLESRHYRGQGPGHVAQPVEAPAALDAHYDRHGGGVCRIGGFRHQYRPDLGGVVSGQAAEGFLPVPEGHAPDGQFQAAGFHDGPGLDKGIMAGNIPADPVGYPANC